MDFTIYRIKILHKSFFYVFEGLICQILIDVVSYDVGLPSHVGGKIISQKGVHVAFPLWSMVMSVWIAINRSVRQSCDVVNLLCHLPSLLLYFLNIGDNQDCKLLPQTHPDSLPITTILPQREMVKMTSMIYVVDVYICKS